MMTNNTMKLASVLGGFLLFGCMGTPQDADEGALQSGLVEVDSGVRPLPRVDSELWRTAPGGCHDRLPADVEFELVRDGVVVALDAHGVPVCVDTIDNVMTELEGDGRWGESSDLGDAYLVAMGFAIPSGNVAGGDPSPQPSCQDVDHQAAGSPADPGGGSGIDRGDPSPQPSTNPRPPSGET